MPVVEIFVIAVALAMDAFAVSMAAAAAGFANNKRAAFRLAFHFGLFQFIMPVAGWAMGFSAQQYIVRVDHWIAFGLLLFVAVRMIFEGAHPDSSGSRDDPSRGMTLIILATATSIDALAVGLSLAALRVPVMFPSLVIGLVTALLCVLAIASGRFVGPRLGERAQIAGGVVLIIIALRILITHLLGK